MLIPVRCLSCGKPLAQLWKEYKERTSKGEEMKKVLEDLKINRYCCRALFMGQKDLVEVAAKFKKY